VGTIETQTETLTLGANYGANTKAIAAALAALSGTLTLETVTTDTDETYDAVYSWSGGLGVTIRFFNGGATMYMNFLIDGLLLMERRTSGVHSGGQTTVVSIQGTDWEAWQVTRGSTCLGGAVLVLTDVFYGRKLAAFRPGAAFAPLAPGGSYDNSFVANYNGTAVSLSALPVGPNFGSSAVILARPLNLYNNEIGISGFVGGTENLYAITTGGNATNTGTVTDRITVDGHTFAGGGGANGFAIRLD
jgi:hypothetical protein